MKPRIGVLLLFTLCLMPVLAFLATPGSIDTAAARSTARISRPEPHSQPRLSLMKEGWAAAPGEIGDRGTVEGSDRAETPDETEYPSQTASPKETAARVVASSTTIRQAQSDEGMTFTVTGYCACVQCCGIWSAQHPSRIGTDYQQKTAAGTIPTAGRTCGADWSILPAGTIIEIEGLGRRTVEDTGAQWIFERYGGRLIDVYFDNHEDLTAFGKQTLEIWIVAQ